MRQRQHLRLVKDHDAVGQIMQLAAPGGTGGIHGLKKLHRRDNHHRHVPILRGQCLPDVLRRCAVGEVELYAGMVFQYIAASQNIPEHLGVLVNDGGIRDDVDHPLHPVFRRMAQRKGQRRHRLSTAGRDGQCVNAFWFTACIQAGVQDLTAQPVQLCLGLLPWLDIRLQPCQQRGDIIVSAPPSLTVHKLFRIQKVGVHQTGIEHPCPERRLQGIQLLRRRDRRWR